MSEKAGNDIVVRKEKMTERISIGLIVFGAVFTLFVLAFQYFYYGYPRKMDLSDVQIADTESYRYFIDSISDSNTQGEYTYVRGWVLHEGEDLIHFNTELVLYSDDLSEAFVFRTKMQSRTDVTTHFDDGYDYDSSGFVVNIKNSLLDDDTVWYIAFLYDDTQDGSGERLIITDKALICEDDEL
ncbi:MAG: hypothetical protein LIO69_00325 [Oscillospiraceae bacterium]|nr:hypothetical protein [Oscillospiraceae bacterium]